MSNEPSPKHELTDSVKLAIGAEVERRLDHPPASLAKFIDDEVEKRVKMRVRQYWTLITAIIIVLGGAFNFLRNQTIAEARQEATRQLAGTTAVEAGKRIITLAADIEQKSQRVNRLVDDIATNRDESLQRLEQLRLKDSVVLLDKDGSLTLKGPVRFQGDVKFDHSLFSGRVYVKGTLFVLGGPPQPFVVVNLANGRVEYSQGPPPNPFPSSEIYYHVASTFGDIIVE
jgi:hypothetical protein